MPEPRFRRLSTHALVFVTAGSGRYLDENRRNGLAVPAPSIIWLTPGAAHAYGPGPDGWREHWVLFEGTMTRVFDGVDGWPPSQPVRPADPGKLAGLREAFARLRQALALPNQRSQLVAATVVAQLVGMALDATARGPRQRARSAVDGLLESAFTPLSVAERAAALGLTVDTLHAVIREATGLSPHEFIIQTRLGRAQQLLADTTSDVAAIAAQVGYDDPAYFSRLFRRRVGISPVQFRRQEAARRS
ncbi:helix-turn-helix domain-containing protein [Ruania zhangjianzhongii]|uniref:helix-turn-helix domain-containing protein n=1 Tax=Ruania zhangjianzhongii TaxID=2603206 RepID=UPI0011CABE40|nr:AraC family transcriptional regulator [Ruania zhangjianzhongii]